MTRTTTDGGPPRVVMVHDYPPLTGGGLALSVRDLTTVLEAGARCSTLTSRLVDHFADDRAAGPPPARLAALAGLRSADVVLAHWTFSFRLLSTLVLLLAPRLGPPVVWVVHTGPSHCLYNRLGGLPDRLRAQLVRSFGRFVERRCAAVVALSASHAGALRRAGVTVTHVLPLPVIPTVAYNEAYLRREANRRPPAVIGVLGELSRLKGTDALPALVDALAPRFAFHIVGNGPLRGPLDRVVAGLDPARRAAVTMVDRVPPAGMPGVYAGLDCVLVLSRTESQCRVALEAMLCGAVVLARRTDGVCDLVVDGRTGFFVDPERPQSLRTVLEAMAADPDGVGAVRAQARRAAEAHFRVSCDGWRSLLAAGVRPALTGA